MKMNLLNKQRSPIRSIFTKVHTELLAEISKEEKDIFCIKKLQKQLENHYIRLDGLNSQIQEELLAKNATEEQFLAEYESMTSYENKYSEAILKVNAVLESVEVETNSESSTKSSQSTNKMKPYRLPKLALTEFAGEPRDWLKFWSQFRTIHQDERLSDEEKFQYLSQSMKKESRAHEVVSSYPPTAENYHKAIDSLKNRFGRDDILIEVYIRDLLQLVLRNVSQKPLDITTLYDSLETHLRSLETLGVTNDKYAAILYPLVESSLPEELLRVWERNRKETDPVKRLTSLLDFLRTEVESDLRVKMAATSFADQKPTGRATERKPQGSKSQPSTSSPLTASDLYNGGKQLICIFCNGQHQSHKCNAELTSDQRKQVIMKKGACYVCLKIGHCAKDCRSSVRCIKCNRRHFVIMCGGVNSKESKSKLSSNQGATLSNFNTTAVMLQTLEVRVKNEDNEWSMRALIDIGSQRSYISRKAANLLKLKPHQTERITHNLFGGYETKELHHKLYHIMVNDMKKENHISLEVLDQEKICKEIQCVPKGPWLKELSESNIDITDVDNQGREIHLLFGADVAGDLYTGKMYSTTSGPVAMET